MAGKVRNLPRIAGAPTPDPDGEPGLKSATIAIYSVKGGVGKTTLSANLAWCAAQQWQRRTLAWDLDAAGGTGYLLGIDPRPSRAADTVFSRQNDPEQLIRPTAWERLDVLPADETIRELEDQLLRIGKRKRLARLTAHLAETYDRILLDCPPVMNELSAQVMRAADLVIVPLPPSPLATRAFELVVQEITRNTAAHPPILPVLSMLDLRRTLHREARAAHPDWPVIPYASAIEQCAVRRQPVGVFAPASPAAAMFAALWGAIEKKLAQRQG